MKKLVDELEATQAEETRLRNEKDDCERKVELAKAKGLGKQQSETRKHCRRYFDIIWSDCLSWCFPEVLS